ncbi:MAG: ABC transporter permease subunit [Armatimonadota bacterium]
MIWTIAKKELLEKLLDFRVVTSFIIGLALALVTVLVTGEDYRVKKAAYDMAVDDAQEKLRNVKVFSQAQPEIVYPPSPLSVFSGGIDVPAPVVISITLDRVPRYEETEVASNPLMRIYDPLDLEIVLQVLFSLLAILLTYDVFAREKEDGTLRLIMSSSVSRRKLLYGKALGSLLIVSTATVMLFGIVLILMPTVLGITLSIDDYLRVLLIAVATLLYVSIFAALGTLASLIFHRSSTSLTASLFIWFFLSVLQPNLNTYLAAEFSPTPRLDDIRPALDEEYRLFFLKLKLLQAEDSTILNNSAKRKFIEGSIQYGPVVMYTPVADADYDVLKSLIRQVQAYRDIGEAADNEWSLYRTVYLSKLDKQLRHKRMLDLLSPAALLAHATSVFARTDIDNYEDFLSQAREYRKRWVEYLDSKGIFSTNAQLFFSRLTKDQIDAAATARRIAKYEKDPDSVPWTQNMEPLDLRDAPAFKPKDTADFSNAILPIFVLILYSAILIQHAERRLGTYDVR